MNVALAAESLHTESRLSFFTTSYDIKHYVPVLTTCDLDLVLLRRFSVSTVDMFAGLLAAFSALRKPCGGEGARP